MARIQGAVGLPVGRVLLNKVKIKARRTKDAIEMLTSGVFPLDVIPHAIQEAEAMLNSAQYGVTVFDYPGAPIPLKTSLKAVASEIRALISEASALVSQRAAA